MDFEGLSVERISHDCFKVKGSKVVYFDPYQVPAEYSDADLVLITHPHYDHCSSGDISKVINHETIIVTIPDAQSKISNLPVREVVLMEPGKKVKIGDLLIEAVPAYNKNKPFHPKENEWVGFILTMDKKKIYHAGDTDLIPEMSSLKDIDIALLPVSGTYVMDALEALEALKIIKPKLAIPMHYGSVVGTLSDAQVFKDKSPYRVEII